MYKLYTQTLSMKFWWLYGYGSSILIRRSWVQISGKLRLY